LKATPFENTVGGKVAGLAYLVPKPEDQGYANKVGLPVFTTAIAVPAGLKATPIPLPPGKVAGLAYLVPKPAEKG